MITGSTGLTNNNYQTWILPADWRKFFFLDKGQTSENGKRFHKETGKDRRQSPSRPVGEPDPLERSWRANQNLTFHICCLRFRFSPVAYPVPLYYVLWFTHISFIYFLFYHLSLYWGVPTKARQKKAPGFPDRHVSSDLHLVGWNRVYPPCSKKPYNTMEYEDMG